MNIPDPTALTQALVKVDTVNPPGHEDACVEMLAASAKRTNRLWV